MAPTIRKDPQDAGRQRQENARRPSASACRVYGLPLHQLGSGCRCSSPAGAADSQAAVGHGCYLAHPEGQEEEDRGRSVPCGAGPSQSAALGRGGGSLHAGAQAVSGRRASVGALSELATCYVELQDDIFADTVVRHLAERFSGDSPLMPQAGDQLLRMAQYYTDRKAQDKKDATYDLYFRRFPKHFRMPAVLYSFGLQKLTAEDYPGAMDYFKKVQAHTRIHRSTSTLSATSPPSTRRWSKN